MKIYAMYDKVAKKVRDYYLAETDEEAVRTGLTVFANMYPLKDMKVLKVGNVSMENPKIEETETKDVNWDIYCLPETKADNFKSVGIEVDFGEKDNEEKEV